LLAPLKDISLLGLIGKGRMISCRNSRSYSHRTGKNGKSSQGKKFVVTAGADSGALDPVRVHYQSFLWQARDMQSCRPRLMLAPDVCLITAPRRAALTPPVGARVIKVNNVMEMLNARFGRVTADVLIIGRGCGRFITEDDSQRKN